MYRTKTGLPWADYLNAKGSQHKRALPATHGLRCSDCHGLHPYKGTHQLVFDYEFRSGRVVILWRCPTTNIVLGEMGNEHGSLPHPSRTHVAARVLRLLECSFV